MNELFIDFNENYQFPVAKRVIFTILGITLLSLGIYLIIRDPLFNGSLGSKLSPIFNVVLGLLFLFQSNRGSLFKSNNFIRINENQLSFKFWKLQKVVEIDWISVTRIIYKPTQIEFIRNNNEAVILKLGLFVNGGNKPSKT